MRQWTISTFLILLLAGFVVGCSSEVHVEDATVTLPRVELVTATPQPAPLANQSYPTYPPYQSEVGGRLNEVAQGTEVAVLLPTAVAAPIAAPTAVLTAVEPMAEPAAALPDIESGITVVTVLASDGVVLRAGPGTDSAALLVIPAGRDLTVIGTDLSDGTSRWKHLRYGDSEGYVRSDLVGVPHLG